SNIAVFMAGKVPVNLNFTAGKESIEGAIEQCEIRTILSSKIFLKKIGLELEPEVQFLENVMKEIPKSSGILFFISARLLPTRFLLSRYRNAKLSPDSLATVIYSSGSTGLPKGIMLSHHNILSNVEAIAQVFWLDDRDRMMGVLPFFHSFGYTGTIWLPMILGFPAVYHPNPMDAKEIGRLVKKYRTTLLISTPTFVSAYIRKCGKEEFASLRYAVVGAEKLREAVAESFHEKFGLDLLEGYGCTEMGPVVAVNVPDIRDKKVFQKGRKFGTVGHPVPAVSVKVVDPENGESRLGGEEGLLLVKGPSLMMGYLKQAEKTAESLRDGWYVTGDIAALDDDGFIRITDRLSRFSKIGGEMVPHIKIEEALNQMTGDKACAVTAAPDRQKGEKIVVFYTDENAVPSDLCEGLSRAGLPKLWIPKRENFHWISEIPILGTGKMDLGGLKKLAIEKEKSTKNG
ncbi:MAG TPA: AMP-binding protein, partial [Nitrospiria bacterium]